jgi:DNA modification methylase
VGVIPAVEIGGARVFLGDCRDVLKTLPDNSVDSIVTDPPYELGFMGKKWDSSGIAYDVTVWAECLRVLKPGGHILAFGGSRTWHRLAVAVEDVGFELRDSIAWIYGSGFPKSLDVSKAIDKTNGEGGRKLKFTKWMRTTGLKVSEASRVLREARLISENGTMAGHFFAESNAGQPAIPTAELWAVLRPHCGEVPDWVDELVARVEAEREVIGQQRQGRLAVAPGQGEDRSAIDLDITLAKTPEAQKWQGWGTALKPAFEPVVVGRKPLVGTVAENVLAWGVGGLNIDGSRIGSENSKINTYQKRGPFGDSQVGNEYESKTVQGRWPANVIIDEVSAGLLDEQSGVSRDGVAVKENSAGRNIFSEIAKPTAPNQGYGGHGGASRFFYVAKASKRDRNEGLEELEAVRAGAMAGNLIDGQRKGGDGSDINAPVRQNFHPTVKPTQLMRYLIKLVTPEGGVVLDPFTGSGSTGKAALLDGYRFVGAELTEEYLPIIEGRLRWASEQGVETDETLF